jgi:hypothetical protein
MLFDTAVRVARAIGITLDELAGVEAPAREPEKSNPMTKEP